MANRVTDRNTQTTDNKQISTCCLCVPFVAIGRLIWNALGCVADFFRNLGSSTRTLTPERVTTSSQPKPLTSEGRYPSSALLSFYKEGLKTDKDITLSLLLEKADNDELERNHFWVQWAFPLTASSDANLTAPILDEETIAAFQRDPELQATLLRLFHRALCFFGLALQEESGTIVTTADFDQRSAEWNRSSNHNHLRFTRILKCLKLLQAPSTFSWSEALFRCLLSIQKKYNKISTDNFKFWQDVHPTIQPEKNQ